MMANRVAGKIKLQSVDQLLGVPEISGTQEIEIVRIHAFPNHPFKVLDDERMDMLRRSRILVVCGTAVDETVLTDIAIANRFHVASSTMRGVISVDKSKKIE